MDVDANIDAPPSEQQPQFVQPAFGDPRNDSAPATSVFSATGFMPSITVPSAPDIPHAPTPPVVSSTTSSRDLRDVQVKIHIRRPEKDSWQYLGRGSVSQEITGHSSRISKWQHKSCVHCVDDKAYSSPRFAVVKTANGKVLVVFNEVSTIVLLVKCGAEHLPTIQTSDLQAEKRGNFVVVGCVDGSRVVSWSLNVSVDFVCHTPMSILTTLYPQALNNSETLRLMASIELACYRCRQALSDPRQHSKSRRRIEKVIKDDKRRRHKRRKDQEALVDAFAKQNLTGEPVTMDSGIATHGTSGTAQTDT